MGKKVLSIRAKKSEYKPKFKGSMYLSNFTEPELLKEKIALCVRVLRKHKKDFDSIAFRGMSGALIAPPVALKLGKTFIMVRKSIGFQSTHSSWMVEGDYAARRYIILDDFRDSGNTITAIRDEIRKAMPGAAYAGFLGARDLIDFDIKEHEENGTIYPLA